MASGRKPTPDEMAVLAKFKGWGGLKDILNEQGYYGRQLKQLLTKEEYEAAKLSTLNAHYTSTKVIGAMYDAVKRLGFTGGRVLEPSMGVGYFFGAMPEKLSRASDLYGVELDGITGNIAKLLYPDAKIDVAGFQDVMYPDGTFDLVVGNVPFSNEVKLPYRNTTYNLHDFFFVKALDETRPGGIVALITSTGTLDKISGKTQRAISERANLVAAFRLPDTAFKGNAGTEVTTDLIFLQKKGPGIEDNGIAFEKIGEIDGVPINEYYVEHPKNILGRLAHEKGMYAAERTVVHGVPGEDIADRLAKAFKTLPQNIMNGAAQTSGARPVTAQKRGERSRPSFTVGKDGTVTITDSQTGEIIEYSSATKAEKKKADTIKEYIGIKDTLKEMMAVERAGGDGSVLRKELNRKYDAFEKAHGALSGRDNKKLLSPDGDYILTTGLEVKSKDGYKKSDIFRVPTLSKQRRTHADTSNEALSIALNESGRVNLDRIRELTGKTLEQTLNDLKDDIILTPDGDYQLVTQYASGNIYEKLDRIKDRPEFDRQRKLLEKALPRRRTADEIDAELGSHWIEPKYINEFLAKTFETNAAVEYSKELGRWALRLGWSGVSRYRTNRVTSQEVAEATLNGKNVEVFDKTSDGKRIYNKEESELAQSKQDMLREDFRNWVFKDKDRAAELVDTFNRTLNAYAPMDYSGLSARMEFNVNPESKKQPREYQKEAAARIVYGGNTLLHNGVGTGKTLTMVLAAHMLKEAGIANKPMFVVPNGKVEDFRSEYLQAYPDAKILALDNEAMSPKQIQATKAMIATGDWDCVIVYRTAFQKMPLSPEAEKAALQRQLDIYEQAARDQAGKRNGSRMFEKGLAARKASLEARIKKVMDKAHDDTTYFDEMGVDALFVDEAHNYKKVGFPTTFNYSGIVADTNEITTDLYMKEELLRDRGNRIVLATATPITNAISEMYNMAMHVAPEVYQAAGIYSFDAWVNTFVNIESQAEIASDGKTFRMKERARNFKNANAMFGLYRQFADIKQTKDYVKDLPEAEVITVTSEATDLHKQILAYLSNLPPDKTLQMNNDGRAAASDLRLATELLAEMGMNLPPEALDLPGSKINRAVSAIVDEYQKSGEIKGTQFVFLDQGVNSGGKRYSFNLYDDLIGKLVKAGIPKDEIAKIGDYDGEDKRQILYDKMNKGKIRVLIGSTAKMGEGVNAQERAVALHHLSVPYRPDNLEQREGRIVRSGNINKKVRIYKYIQEESYDSYLWQMIERKAAYLAEAYNGGDATEVDELSDAQVNAREAKAIATGNPLIMEKMSLQDKIARLKALQRGWRSEQADAERTLGISKEKLKEAEEKAQNAAIDVETYRKAAEAQGDNFRIEIGGKQYDTRKDAAEALTQAIKKEKLGKLGSVYGFDFGLRYDSKINETMLYLKGQNEYFNSIGDSSMGNITRILNLAEKGPVTGKANYEKNVQVYTSAIKDAKTTIGAPFKQQQELYAAQKRMREIDAELGITGHGVAIEGESEKAKETVHSFAEPMTATGRPFRKVEAGMTDAERYKILKDRIIPLDATADNSKLAEAETKLNTAFSEAYTLKIGERKKLMKKLGDEFSVFKDYTNTDVELTFTFSRGNMAESTAKQGGRYDDFAKMLTCFDKVVENAVGVEVHNRNESGYKPDETLANVYVLFSAFQDGDRIVPVKLEVKEFKDGKDNALYVAVALQGIKKSEIVNTTKAANQGGQANVSPSLNVRIADIFKKINPADRNFIKYIPGQFLGRSAETVDNDTGDPFSRPERWTTTRVGDADKTPMRLSDIVEKIRHDYHINITKGHVTGRRSVRGQYRPGNPGIRTREALDLPTISHELGHHLDNMYGLEDLISDKKAILDELKDAMPADFKASYKEDQLAGEGIAEYMRRYLTNRETAAIDCPKFTKLLKETLSASDAALLDSLADEVNAYYALDADTATSSIRSIENSRGDFRTWKESLQDKAHVLYQAVVDSNDSIKRFDREMGTGVYKFASNAAYADDRAGQLIIGDLRDIDGEYVGPGLKTVLHGLDLGNKKEYALFGEYLVVKHGPERLAEGMRIFADDRKNSSRWMIERQAAIEAERPDFKEISERLYEFQQQLLQTWGVETGIISADAAKAWLERWQYYVPLNRAVDIESRAQGAKRGFVNQNGPYKKARGSGLDIINPIDNIISNMIKLVHLSVYNDVALQMADACKNAHAPAWWMEQIPPPKVVTKVGTEPLKEQIRGLTKEALEIMDDDSVTKALDGFMELILEKTDDVLMQYSNRRPSGNIVTVLRAGKPEYWKVNDPQLLKTLSGMKRGTVGGVLEAYGTISRFMTGNITGRNVVWSIFSNMPRDLATLFTYSKERNPLKVFPAMASAYVNKAKGDKADPIYLEYLSMGGGNTSAYSNDVDIIRRTRKQLEGKFDGNPLHWLEWVSDVVEMGPRFATYKLMRQQGMSTHEAFYEATDITVNFRRGGDISRQINKVVPFFNAGVQGADKFARWVTAADVPAEDRQKVSRGRFLMYLAVSAALAGISYAINHFTKDREEDYEQLSNYTKNSYWNIPLGDGKYFAITKPRELGVLSSLMEAILSRYAAQDPHAFEGFYEYATDVFLPGGAAELAQGDWMSAVGSTGIFGVGAYMMANRDFLGRPIVSSALANLEPKQQYTGRTSMLAKGIGSAFNISPAKLDYFFEQTLGGWWKYQRALFPVDAANRDLTLGVGNQYVKDNQYSTDLTNRMYDRAEASRLAYNSDKTDPAKELEYKMDSRMTDFYGSFYKLTKTQPESEKSRALRQTVLDMVAEYEKTRESGQWPDIFERIKDVGLGDMGTYLPSVMNTVIKDAESKPHELSPEQYVDYQLNYNTIYYSLVEQSVKAATTDRELAAIIKGAKAVAKERALATALTRIGAPTEPSKYGGAKDSDVAVFKGMIDIVNDDGLQQTEVIDIIKQMQKTGGLSRQDAYDLFHSQYESDKNNPWARKK